MLPTVLLGEFTAAEAKEVGVGIRQLARLRAAGLAVRSEDCFRLVDPTRAPELALAAVGHPAALCGVTAARRYGWLDAEPDEDVHLLVPRARCPRPWPGTRLHRGAQAADEVVLVAGVRLTSPVRTALDVAGELQLAESLPMLDKLLRTGVLEKEQLLDGLGDRGRWPGRLPAAIAVDLADARHASNPESVFRAMLHQAGLPAPVPQHPVWLDGTFIGRADFAWPRHRLIAEIDGFEFHNQYGSFIKDRQRGRKTLIARWQVLHFAAAEVLDQPDGIMAEVRAALALGSAL